MDFNSGHGVQSRPAISSWVASAPSALYQTRTQQEKTVESRAAPAVPAACLTVESSQQKLCCVRWGLQEQEQQLDPLEPPALL